MYVQLTHHFGIQAKRETQLKEYFLFKTSIDTMMAIATTKLLTLDIMPERARFCHTEAHFVTCLFLLKECHSSTDTQLQKYAISELL